MTKTDYYHTKQKDIIYNLIKKQKYEFTIKDIYNQIKDRVGLTTIYRLVDKLVEEGRLSKYITKDNMTYYQYLEECNQMNHFYLKCEQCGIIIHIDCNCIEEMSKHILIEHKFLTNKMNIVINGICQNCANKGE